MKNRNVIVIGVMTLLLSSIVIVWTSENVSATTFTVNSNGGGDFLTISEAVNAASDDDIIQVQAGSGYTENVVVDKELTITGTGMNRPVVAGPPPSSSPVFDIQDRDVTIDFLEIDGTGTNSIAGIMSDVQTNEHDNVLISDCEIHDFNNGGYGVCIKRTNPEYQYPTNHIIEESEIHNCNIGISISSDPDNQVTYPNHIVRKCEIHSITKHDGTMGQGIYNHGDKNTFEDSKIYYSEDKGLYLYDSYECDVLDKNTNGYPFQIHHNDVGLYLLDCDECDIQGYDSDRLLTISDNLNNGVYIDTTMNSDLQYLDIDENCGYGIFFDESDSNTMRYSRITDNDYIYEEYHKGNYLYLCESSTNLFEGNTIDETGGSSSINIVCGSENNDFDDNSLDGNIYIGSADENKITDMDFEYLDINCGENNTIQNCDISFNGDDKAQLIFLIKAHNTTIERANLDGVNDEMTGIKILDSKDVEISGYEAGSPYSEIDNCDIILNITSEDFTSNVHFHHYRLFDASDVSYDIILLGSSPHYSDVEHDDSLSGDPLLEKYIQSGCSWHP